MGYKRLYKNLIDIIKEEQAKLGFRRESIRLYYPLSSLNHFFETQDTEEQMKNRLHGIPDFIKETLGDIKVTSKKERFCFYIPEEGSNYVHENTHPNEFIKELVEIVGKHGCKKEDIIALFKKHDKNVFVEEIHNGEFDYLIRGEQTSELSDVSSDYPDIENRQDSGYGIKFSSMYRVNDFAIGPYIDYWNIDKSDTEVFSDSTGTYYGYEPKNTTVEFGIKASMRF